MSENFDPIEQSLTGQILLPAYANNIALNAGNGDSVYLKDLGAVEYDLNNYSEILPLHTENTQPLNSSHATPDETKASAKTLGEFISEHIPEHLQADVLAIIHKKLFVDKGLDGENSPSNTDQSNQLC